MVRVRRRMRLRAIIGFLMLSSLVVFPATAGENPPEDQSRGYARGTLRLAAFSLSSIDTTLHRLELH